MKKSLFLIGISTSLLLLVGCGQSTVVPTAPVPNLFATGGTNSENFQEITGTETGAVLAPQTTPQSGSLTPISGATTSIAPTTASGKDMVAEVKKVIQERATKPVAKDKLTEDDIDVLEKAIQIVKQK